MLQVKKYPGSKTAAGVGQQVISQIPKCGLFIEGMCGAASITMKMLSRPASFIVNDINSAVLKKLGYGSLYEAPPVQNVFSFAEKKLPRLHVTTGDFKGLVFENLHYQDLIAKYDYADHGGVVFYFDPPYLKSTRSHQGYLYKYDWELADHQQFIEQCLSLKSFCMVSHFPCELYDDAFSKWRKITYQAMTRAGLRDECLYMNFPQPALLQDYSFVGENFTDRQRIGRKVKRLIARLQKEPGNERAAILSSIIDHFNYITR